MYQCNGTPLVPPIPLDEVIARKNLMRNVLHQGKDLPAPEEINFVAPPTLFADSIRYQHTWSFGRWSQWYQFINRYQNTVPGSLPFVGSNALYANGSPLPNLCHSKYAAMMGNAKCSDTSWDTLKNRSHIGRDKRSDESICVDADDVAQAHGVPNDDPGATAVRKEQVEPPPAKSWAEPEKSSGQARDGRNGTQNMPSEYSNVAINLKIGDRSSPTHEESMFNNCSMESILQKSNFLTRATT